MNYLVESKSQVSGSHFEMYSIKRGDKYLTKTGWVTEAEVLADPSKTYPYKTTCKVLKSRGDKIVTIACQYAR